MMADETVAAGAAGTAGATNPAGAAGAATAAAESTAAAAKPAGIGDVESADPDIGWYALYATAGFETKARERLIERIRDEGMEKSFGEILLPVGKTVEIRRGKREEVEEKLFPSYLFVQMKMNATTWHLVRKTKWINGFIGGSSEEPRPLTRSEMLSIRQRQENTAPAMRAKFVIGESIRIKSGPFNDFNGVIETINDERERLTVSVTVFGRSTPVELDFDQAEKL